MNIGLKLILVLELIALTHSANITCDFYLEKYHKINVQICDVKGELKIYDENEEVKFTEIRIKSTQGFKADKKEILYIPQGINKCCSDFNALVIKNSKLRDITSENLVNFPSLLHLDLSYNEIRILEADLFNHTKNLKSIHLNDNKIFAVLPTIWNNLKDLSFLTINNCSLDQIIANNQNEVENMKKQFSENGKCWSNVSKIDIEVTRNLLRIERIEVRQQGRVYRCPIANNHQANFTQEVEKLTMDIEELKNLHKEDINNLNQTISERIKRSADEILTKINGKLENVEKLINISDKNLTERFKKIENMAKEVKNFKEDVAKNFKSFNSSIDSLLTNLNKLISNNKELKDKTEKLEKKLEKLDKDITDLRSNIADIKQNFQKSEIIFKLSLKSLEESQSRTETSLKSEISGIRASVYILHEKINTTFITLNEKKDIQRGNSHGSTATILGSINTLLLATLLIILCYINCHKNRENPQNDQQKPPVANPTLTEAKSTTQGLQNSDNNSGVKSKGQNYEQDEDDIYACLNLDQTSAIQDDVDEHKSPGYSNEIYGTVSNEDLYSEVVSPNKKQKVENNDNYDLYAVVYKPQKNY